MIFILRRGEVGYSLPFANCSLEFLISESIEGATLMTTAAKFAVTTALSVQ